jgi:NAD(P)-dependent dehydrogenase (short-subunit alcohol dehydrogenase family)
MNLRRGSRYGLPYIRLSGKYLTGLKVNYIGYFLFSKILLPTLQKTATASPKGNVRIINISSDGHAKLAPKEGIAFSDIIMKRNYSVWARYRHSKLANVLHSKERYPDILSVSLHPGTVKT